MLQPRSLVDDALRSETLERIVKPTIQGMLGEGIRFRGILYVGLMLTNRGLQVLEFNARFGDPETQVQMPRLDTPLIEILQACSSGRLDEVDVRWKSDAAVCVVMTAEGYPGRYERGRAITGIPRPKPTRVSWCSTRGPRWQAASWSPTGTGPRRHRDRAHSRRRGTGLTERRPRSHSMEPRSARTSRRR